LIWPRLASLASLEADLADLHQNALQSNGKADNKNERSLDFGG
jgi:hypothetical protein